MSIIKAQYNIDRICQKWNVEKDERLHMNNVACLIEIVSSAMGIDDVEKGKIKIAAQLHDIGKVLIPKYILNKPGKLTAEECEIMKKHVEYSIAILKVEEIDNEILDYIIKHHERKNGTGYPNQISSIRIADEILSICDIFDALISNRPYRKAKPVNEAWEIINEYSFDKSLIEAFHKEIISKYFVPESNHLSNIIEYKRSVI